LEEEDENAIKEPSRSAMEDKALHSIPEAPYHPSLRPAGIRELQRRQWADEAAKDHQDKELRIEEDSPPFSVHPRTSGTDTPSSLTTDAEGVGKGLPEISHSAQEWWDGIAQRRSSEFGGAI